MANDTVELAGYVGPISLSDGAHTGQVRLTNFGEMAYSKVNPDLYEHTLRGNAFVYSTAAAGAASVAPTTSNAPMIWNPTGSGKNLVVTKVAIGWVGTNTAAAGNFEYAFLPSAGSQIGTGAPVVSLTQVSGVNLLLSGGNVSVMRFAPTTVSLTSAPTYLAPMGVGMTNTTVASTAAPFNLVDYVNGQIIVPPGVAFFVVANISILVVTSIAMYGLELPIPAVA
jgi:hypothetical protein